MKSLFYWKSKNQDRLVFGEVAYDADNKQLVVGDENGHGIVVAKIIEGPHDKNLYAQVDNRETFIPLRLPGSLS